MIRKDGLRLINQHGTDKDDHLDKHQRLLEQEIKQLKSRIDSEPQQVIAIAQQCLSRAEQLDYSQGILQSQIILARCAWVNGDYRLGLKTIKQAYLHQHSQDNDDYLAEIFHVHALHFWGQAKYYTAQQYWINALEQASLVDDTEILIESLIGLGNIWRMTHDYQLACSTHELAVKVANNCRIAWLEGKARILWAWDLYLLNHYLDMLSVLDGAEEALQTHADQTWQAEIWDFRSLALLGLERLADAEQATQRAHDLAERHNLPWMKAHAYISRARLELLRKDIDKAGQLLALAEQSAEKFDDRELLSQICYQQSLVAEECGNYPQALAAFQKYRQLSLSMQREHTAHLGLDKARLSKRQLEQRARKLTHRIRSQYEYDPQKHLSNVVSENYWWEQLMLYKAELKQSKHCVLIIRHDDPCYLDTCTEIIHTLCVAPDLLSRLSPTRLALLLAEIGPQAEQFYHTLEQILDVYPWQRKGLTGPKPRLTWHDILSFPFTLEQLEQLQAQEEANGNTAQ